MLSTFFRQACLDYILNRKCCNVLSNFLLICIFQMQSAIVQLPSSIYHRPDATNGPSSCHLPAAIFQMLSSNCHCPFVTALVDVILIEAGFIFEEILYTKQPVTLTLNMALVEFCKQHLEKMKHCRIIERIVHLV